MTLLIALALAPLIMLTGCFVLEVFLGLRPLPRATLDAENLPRTVVIVPAHDEEVILRHRLTALKAAAGPGVEILLVADNCSDATADIARDVGVRVIERTQSERRGKGFALDFARQYLRELPPEVVVVVDADCAIDAKSLAQLIAHCIASRRPCQAMNLQLPTPDSSPTVRLSTFAFFVKNVIRQRGLQRLTGHGHLLGTGMAFPWDIFAEVELASGEIVEDLKLSQELARRGRGAVVVEEARVLSNAESDRNTLSQRQRWEGGFLRNALRVGPSLFVRSVARANWRGVWAAVNSMIPPIALLIILDITFLLLAGVLTALTGASPWPVLVLFGSVLLASFALGFAWLAGGSKFVTPAALVRIPFYILWKVSLYLGLVREGAPKEWRRTPRGD